MSAPQDELSQALAQFLDPRGRTDIRFGLDRIRQALARLGDPQDKLPKPIHIAGTNGKGSVAAFLRHMAEASGLAAHVFTSPHLVRVNERIRLAGRLVEDHELVTALDEVFDTGVDLTYFEGLTAAGYLLFSRTAADLTIIETGAGGTLDSTNVITRPAVNVITQIAMDHQKLFGANSLAEIARVKAGIMRRGVPVVLAGQSPRVMETLETCARQAGATALAQDRDWTGELVQDAFTFRQGDHLVRAPWLGLAGAHQASNAGAACAAFIAALGEGADTQAMGDGLRETHWPGRLQALGEGPLRALVKAPVTLDGAHNPAGAKALAATMARRKSPGGRTVVIFAVQGAKDVTAMIEAMASEADYLVACPLPSAGQEGGGGEDPTTLALLAEDKGLQASAAASIESAFKLAAAANPSEIYVCGSLYLVGKVLELNGEKVV